MQRLRAEDEVLLVSCWLVHLGSVSLRLVQSWSVLSRLFCAHCYERERSEFLLIYTKNLSMSGRPAGRPAVVTLLGGLYLWNRKPDWQAVFLRARQADKLCSGSMRIRQCFVINRHVYPCSSFSGFVARKQAAVLDYTAHLQRPFQRNDDGTVKEVFWLARTRRRSSHTRYPCAGILVGSSPTTDRPGRRRSAAAGRPPGTARSGRIPARRPVEPLVHMTT